jgi:competence protein ComEA
VPDEDEEPAEEETEPEPEAKEEPEPEEEPEPLPPAEVPEGMLSLSVAEFDDLRELGMSVTQAKRVLRYRDEHGGFTSVEQLNEVPGFPRTFLAEVKHGLVP